MLDGRLGSLGAWLGVLALGAVCAGVGIVQARRGDRASALEAELRALQERSAREGEVFESRLRRTRAHAARLRAALAQERARSGGLERALADAEEQAVALERRASAAAETLRNEPPPLDLRIAPGDGPQSFVALADNSGGHDIRVLESRGRLWLGAWPAPIAWGPRDLAVAPGEETLLLELRVPAAGSLAVARGELLLRGALCAVYERALDTDPTPWAREIWFEVRPETNAAAVVHQERWLPWPDEVPCTARDHPRGG